LLLAEAKELDIIPHQNSKEHTKSLRERERESRKRKGKRKEVETGKV
jgi:hypothetical protein